MGLMSDQGFDIVLLVWLSKKKRMGPVDMPTNLPYKINQM